MFRTMSFLTVLGLFGLTAGAKAQTKMTAKEVLTKAVEAAGGLDALKKFPAGKEKSKGTMDFGGVDISFTADASFMEPDKMKTASPWSSWARRSRSSSSSTATRSA